MRFFRQIQALCNQLLGSHALIFLLFISFLYVRFLQSQFFHFWEGTHSFKITFYSNIKIISLLCKFKAERFHWMNRHEKCYGSVADIFSLEKQSYNCWTLLPLKKKIQWRFCFLKRWYFRYCQLKSRTKEKSLPLLLNGFYL